MTEIYPRELSLTSDDAILVTNYLDLRIEIKQNEIRTSLFDRRDAFGFEVVNFPDLTGNIPMREYSYHSQFATLAVVKTLQTFVQEL